MRGVGMGVGGARALLATAIKATTRWGQHFTTRHVRDGDRRLEVDDGVRPVGTKGQVQPGAGATRGRCNQG